MIHPIVQLAGLIDWETFERDYANHFPSHTGRPATRARLATGLLLLQHTHKLSDVSVLTQWLQNPYFQFFCGEEFMRHHLPVDPSSLSRWRKALGRPGGRNPGSDQRFAPRDGRFASRSQRFAQGRFANRGRRFANRGKRFARRDQRFARSKRRFDPSTRRFQPGCEFFSMRYPL